MSFGRILKAAKKRIENQTIQIQRTSLRFQEFLRPQLFITKIQKLSYIIQIRFFSFNKWKMTALF